MMEISVSSKKIISSQIQIKGEKQVSDLTDSVQLISHKFEKDRKAKDELITKTPTDGNKTQVTELTDKISNFSVKDDEQEQYCRRNCVLIDGVEDIDTLSSSINASTIDCKKV